MTTTRNRRAVATLVLLGILLVTLAGCDGEKDVPAVTGGTTGPAATEREENGPAQAEINAYVEKVRELVHVSDQLNAGNQDFVDRYNSEDVPDDEFIAHAESNALAFADMVDQLEAMDVPKGLGGAHDMIISGFNKWRQMYELDARGVREKDGALLDQARALDNEAVAEVNEAIDEINELKG